MKYIEVNLFSFHTWKMSNATPRGTSSLSSNNSWFVSLTKSADMARSSESVGFQSGKSMNTS